MESLATLGVLAIAFVVVAPIVLFVKLGNANYETQKLARRVTLLEDELDQLRRRGAAPEPEAPPEREAMEPPAISEGGPPAETGTPEPPQMPEPAMPETTAPPSPITGGTAPPVQPARKETPPPGRSLEETLASQWMVWLGAVAVALSAVFLFSYAVEQGWLTPFVRVLMGLLLGGALLAAGEWTERNPVGAGRARDMIPSALSGAGVFAVFVSLYAAHALFGLLGPATGFVALGLTSYAALALSLRQGWFVALMGMIGGYLVPALIESPTSAPLPVFLYLFVLSAGALALMMWRRWWWFAALALLGALGWPWLWMIAQFSSADTEILGFYLTGIAALFALFSTRLPVKLPEVPYVTWLSAMLSDTSGLGFTLAGVLCLILADVTDYDTAAFLFLALYGAVALVFAMRRAALESLVVAAALIALAGFVLWPQPIAPSSPEGLASAQFPPFGPGYGPFVMPPEFVVFARSLLGFAVLFGVGGFLGIRGARTPAVWAGVAASVPVLLLVIGYWRIGGLEIDMRWASLAAGLSALLIGGAALEARRPARSDVALAFLAAGATAALALAFTCVLREAWLTVALSVEVYAVAWIWGRLPVRELRALAGVVASVVIVRLLLNENVVDYEGSVAGVFGWVLYGYGLPALALGAAARIFKRQDDDILVPLCEIAAVGFVLVMVSLQLSLWTSGSIAFTWRLYDQSVQSVWWIIAAGVLLHRHTVARRAWTRIAGMIVLGAALLSVFFVQVLADTPLFDRVFVGRWPILNLLALAYLVPGLLFGLLGRLGDFELPERYRQALSVAAGVLAFVWLTLETRHAFWGSLITLYGGRDPTNAELYAYSAVWILYALALLAAGIWRGSTAMRYASLAVLMVAVAKVFLFDMSDLTGLFRVASFLGLGVVLIAIGRVYQRFVFKTGGPAEKSAGTAKD